MSLSYIIIGSWLEASQGKPLIQKGRFIREILDRGKACAAVLRVVVFAS
jgi:hypothetical protein